MQLSTSFVNTEWETVGLRSVLGGGLTQCSVRSAGHDAAEFDAFTHFGDAGD